MGERDWQSSEYPGHDRLAGVKLVFARIFGDGENPLAWGFKVGAYKGTPIKLHLLFVVYLLAELIFTLPANRDGMVFVFPRLIAMVLLVAAREIIHARAALKAGGSAVEIMLWPMGGLIPHEIPDEWAVRLRVALTPVLFNLAILPLFAIPLVLLTHDWQSLLVNPLTLRGPDSVLVFQDGTTAWWLVSLGAIHSVNLILIVFNLLLPMYPLDGAYILEASLLRSKSEHQARWTVVHTGLITATVVGILAIVMKDATSLFALCVVCGLICSMHRRQLQFLQTADMIPGLSRPIYTASEKSEKNNEHAPAVDQDEIDRILTKISTNGIAALTRKERRTLKRATETSRHS